MLTGWRQCCHADTLLQILSCISPYSVPFLNINWWCWKQYVWHVTRDAVWRVVSDAVRGSTSTNLPQHWLGLVLQGSCIVLCRVWKERAEQLENVKSCLGNESIVVPCERAVGVWRSNGWELGEHLCLLVVCCCDHWSTAELSDVSSSVYAKSVMCFDHSFTLGKYLAQVWSPQKVLTFHNLLKFLIFM